MVAYCLDHGAIVVSETTLLSGVIQRCSFESYKLLVKAKAVEIDGYVPWYSDVLGVMASSNEIKWVRFCLEQGTNPNMNLIEEYMTPLAAAAENENAEMVKLLPQRMG